VLEPFRRYGLRLRMDLTVDLGAPLLGPAIGVDERAESIRWQVRFDELDHRLYFALGLGIVRCGGGLPLLILGGSSRR
jgi:hypothetical protein